MTAPEAIGTANLLTPCDGPPPCLPVVHILPPSSSTTTPTPLPVIVPTLSPTTDPCGDFVWQPAIFSPTASSIPGIAQPVGCAGTNLRVKDTQSLLVELSLPSEEALLQFVQQGLSSAVESVQNSSQKQGSMEAVKKQVAVMAERWSGGRLSPTIRRQLGSLVAALKEEKLEEAQEWHLALMANHSTEVSEWLAAVGLLIQELCAKQSQLLGSLRERQGQYKANSTTDMHKVVENNVLSNASLCERHAECPKVASSPSQGRETGGR